MAEVKAGGACGRGRSEPGTGCSGAAWCFHSWQGAVTDATAHGWETSLCVAAV